MIKKLLVKLGLFTSTLTLAAVAVANVSQTAACDFDLKIDDSCSYNGAKCVLDKTAKKYFWQGTKDPCSCAWKSKNLDKDLFFELDDIKPGDRGENTVSLHITGQEAWICGQVVNVKNYDNGCTESEKLTDATCGNSGLNLGELQNFLKINVWQDNDCDNILDQKEKIILDGVPFANGMWPVFDSNTISKPLNVDKTYCIGIKWAVPADMGNSAQTDSLLGDLKFTAVSARENKRYVCGNVCVRQAEICDGKDNDCDGKIDEGDRWSNLGKTCTAGQGKCKKSGTYVCNAQDPAGKTVCSVNESPLDKYNKDCKSFPQNPGGK